MFLCFLFLLFGTQATYVRPWHVIYVQNPDESAQKEKKAILKRIQEVVADLNNAMAFHDLPMKFEPEKQKLHVKKDAPWVGKTLTCGERTRMCGAWADSFGRKRGELDIWSCILPDSYFEGCGGMAETPGDVNWVGYNAFLDPKRIGILHEIGHNLGCGHETAFCQPNFKEFAAATGKRYQTLMGGGQACDPTGLEQIRLRLYTDANKSYCEGDVCLKLGAPGFDCAGKMREEFVHVLKRVSPKKCSKRKMNDSILGYCVYKEQKICAGTKLEGEIKGRSICANLIESSCPSKTFYHQSNRGSCVCCDDVRARKLIVSPKTDLYRVSSETVLPSSLLNESSDSSESVEIQHDEDASDEFFGPLKESYLALVLDRLLNAIRDEDD